MAQHASATQKSNTGHAPLTSYRPHARRHTQRTQTLPALLSLAKGEHPRLDETRASPNRGRVWQREQNQSGRRGGEEAATFKSVTRSASPEGHYDGMSWASE